MGSSSEFGRQNGSADVHIACATNSVPSARGKSSNAPGHRRPRGASTEGALRVNRSHRTRSISAFEDFTRPIAHELRSAFESALSVDPEQRKVEFDRVEGLCSDSLVVTERGHANPTVHPQAMHLEQS